MKTLILTNEYPPNVYGGAGVHVDCLSRELCRLIDVEVRCFGNQHSDEAQLRVRGVNLDPSGWTAPAPLHSVFGAMQRCLDFNTNDIDADIVHLHTWYTHFGGILAKLNYGVPMVVTVHSLEPMRPWKREQLGGGYDFSCWVEKTAIEMADAVIAVSEETRKDIIRLFHVDPTKVHVLYNGVDTDVYRKVDKPDRITPFGIDPEKPYVLFVGRITRQKGIVHFVNAIKHMDPGFQIVLCAGAPDTKEIQKEMKDAVVAAQSEREGIIWIDKMVDEPTKVALYSHSSLFVCPSIYEPFGIINLEAMACEVPVVASAVGGIKEVVMPKETGALVPIAQQAESPFEPIDPPRFSKDLAAAVNHLMGDGELRKRMGKAGRKRAVEVFSWRTIATQTVNLYKRLLD